jgi:signal transduction histidine kinase
VCALPTLTLVLVAVTIALETAAPAFGTGTDMAARNGPGFGVLGLLLAGLATVVLMHDARQRFGWVLAGVGVCCVVNGLAHAYLRYDVHTDGTLPAMSAAVEPLTRFGAFLPVGVVVLIMIFPNGRLVDGRWGRAARVGLALMCLGVLLVNVSPPAPGDPLVEFDLPPHVEVELATLPILAGLAHPGGSGRLLLTVGTLVASASVVVRYRRSEGLDRDRMRWLLWSVIAVVMAHVFGWLLLSEVAAAHYLSKVVLAVLPAAAMTIGIVRPDIVPIHDLMARTMVGGALCLVLVVIGLGALAVLPDLLDDPVGQRQLVLTVLLVTVSLYGALRQRFLRVLRRLRLGDRDDRYDAVAGLAASLESADEGPGQPAAVARAVASAVRVGFVSVEVERNGGERVISTYGHQPAETRTLPITYRDQRVGSLVLPATGLRSRLSRRDERLLGDLVRQAATAARTSQLAAALQDSRERLVMAREEERRRIRRDLHDGLGPTLAGVLFRIESARLLVDRDSDAVRAHLVETSDQVKDLVADVRRLVHQLRPPALDDLGLAGAVGQLGRSLPVPVHLDADDLGPLPAAVEVAVYRIAAEGLTNAARHGDAHTCAVRLRVEDGHVLVEIADDGVGIRPDAQAGVGVLSIRERAAELGGRSEVTCPSGGGTVVRAWLPIRHTQAAAPTG